MKSINQTLTGYFDDITSSKINSNELVSNNVSCTNTFMGAPASNFTNTTSNIQTQLNTLNATTNNLQTLANEGGSGFFLLYMVK